MAVTVRMGAGVLDAYQLSEICVPKLLPRIGINREEPAKLHAGDLMTQMIDPRRFNALDLLWEGGARPGRSARRLGEEGMGEATARGRTSIGAAEEVSQPASLVRCYGYGRDLGDLRAAVPLLEQGVEVFRKLVT